MLGRGQQRVEEQLAVLAARVALAGERRAAEDVVAVDRVAAREDAVVEADQADHPVRHRAHRHHRADGEACRCGSWRGSGGRPAATRAARGRRRAAASAPRSAVDDAAARASSRSNCGSCQASSPPTSVESRHAARAARPSTRPAAGRRLEPGQAVAQPVDVARPAGRPGRSRCCRRRRAGGRGPRWRWSSPLIATPSSTRSRPDRQVLWAKRSIENGCRGRRVEPPPDAGLGAPSGRSGRGRRR